MVRRKKIGLYFVFDIGSNSGIVNYLFSLIMALGTLDDIRKPWLVIFYSKNAPIEMIKAEKYPFITFKNVDPLGSLNIFCRVVNKFARIISKRNWIKNSFTVKDADYLFPFPINSHFDAIKGKVHWLVDFNPYYFSNHLSQEQRNYYFDHTKSIIYSTDKVVLSSQDAFNDLKKFHADYSCKIEILSFAAVLPAFSHVNIEDIKSKFDITCPYVMTPNQFWTHKNHMVMLKAAVLLKARGVNFQMIFTGSTKVALGSDYYTSLLNFVSENDLQNVIRCLGIVDRAEQLTLMKHSIVLVQPSLFEGWSTLVEESKALNKHIVISDLPVHREQIDFNCTFFDPGNENSLADILEDIFKNGVQVIPYDYNLNIKKYAERILEIFN